MRAVPQMSRNTCIIEIGVEFDKHEINVCSVNPTTFITLIFSSDSISKFLYLPRITVYCLSCLLDMFIYTHI